MSNGLTDAMIYPKAQGIVQTNLRERTYTVVFVPRLRRCGRHLHSGAYTCLFLFVFDTKN